MAELGNKKRLYLTTALSGTTFTWLTGEQSSSFNRTAESVDVSDKSNDWKQFIYGSKSATADATIFADSAAGGPQHELLSALHNGQTVYCFLGTLDAAGKPSEGDLFEALVTSIGDTYDNGSVASRAVSLQVTGAPEHYPTITAAS